MENFNDLDEEEDKAFDNNLQIISSNNTPKTPIFNDKAPTTPKEEKKYNQIKIDKPRLDGKNKSISQEEPKEQNFFERFKNIIGISDDRDSPEK